MYRYFIGAGSNIDPNKNVILIIRELIKEFDEIHISRIVKTKPVNVEGGDFLNFNICLNSEYDLVKINKILKKIEAKSGRDLTAHNKKYLSRPADLDILFRIDEYDLSIDSENVPTESYLKSTFIELIEWLKLKCMVNAEKIPDGVELYLDKQTIGLKPVTVSMNMFE